MKATVLADNIGEGPLAGEWGLSIYIEYENKKILLDTGASALFTENAKAMDIPLENIDFGILSHAHYDHAMAWNISLKETGMPNFICRNHAQKTATPMKKAVSDTSASPKIFLPPIRTD